MHGRAKNQKFIYAGNWNYIKECASVAAGIPVFGNGDVFNYEDYNQRLADYQVEG